jgi:hypothetical protein
VLILVYFRNKKMGEILKYINLRDGLNKDIINE